MRTSTLITSYIQAAIFAALALRCYRAWARERERRSFHLTWAAGLFAVSSLLGAITNTLFDATKGQSAPRWEGIVSSIITFLAIYGFLVFLSDFIRFPRWVHGLLIAATGLNIAMAVVERPDLRFDARTFQIVPIPGVHNPVAYRTYIGYVLVYFAVALGVLAVAFLAYALKTSGLARMRMLLIGGGFALLCVVIGLLPRLLFGHPSAQTIRNLLNVLEYVALVSGPLLLVGFAPPRLLRERFQRLESRREGPQEARAPAV